MKPRAALLSVLVVAGLLPGALTAEAATITPAGELRTPVWTSYDKRVVPSELFSAPVVGDITGDKVPEVVAGFPNGHVYVWDQAGRRILDLTTGTGAIQASPTLADLTGDGVADIVGGTMSGRVFGYSARGGVARTVFSRQLNTWGGLNGVFGSPVVTDLDRDGRVEVIATSLNQRLNVWTTAGAFKPGFPLFLVGTMLASPVAVDLNRDGLKEIVVAYDRSPRAGDAGGGTVSVIDHRGRVKAGWPKKVNQVVWSTPAVADVDGDGFRDIVVGSGVHFSADRGRAVYAWNRNGVPLPGWPVATRSRVWGAPAIGDVDGDGRKEVAFMDEHNYVYVVNRVGKLLPGWPRCSATFDDCSGFGHASPSLADVTGDGRVDIVTGGHTTLNVWSASGQKQASFLLPKGTGATTAAPTIASVGGKATILLVARMPAGTSFYGKVMGFSTGAALGPAPWPRYKRDAANTGVG